MFSVVKKEKNNLQVTTKIYNMCMKQKYIGRRK